jgi:hypothetical protein
LSFICQLILTIIDNIILVLGIFVTSFSYKNSAEQYKYLRFNPIEFITH